MMHDIHEQHNNLLAQIVAVKEQSSLSSIFLYLGKD